MTRYALLLRGVNVGTKNSLPMADFRSMLARLGCVDVRTYIQSGNAVFGSTRPEPALTRAIEGELESYMGRPIATTLRTVGQMEEVIAGNPFQKVATNPSLLCVTFFSRRPSPLEVKSLTSQTWEPELVALKATELYTWHPNGQARSPLREAIQALSVRGAVTTRNWNTVLKVAELLREA